MDIVDTHTHIYTKDFDADRKQVIERAKSVGIRAVLLPNEDASSIGSLLATCGEYPGYAFPMMGLHPTSVGNNYIEELRQVETALGKHIYYGIGEIGLDFYWDTTYQKEQVEVFKEQLKWSAELGLPVSIHSRKSMQEVLDCIHEVGSGKLRGVFHCFGGTPEEWREIAKLPSFYVGFGGVITFKKKNTAGLLEQIPVERIVVETDAPYLAPVPHRGSRNEPAYILETLKKIAECKKIGVEEVAKAVYKNSLDLFNISNENIGN